MSVVVYADPAATALAARRTEWHSAAGAWAATRRLNAITIAVMASVRASIAAAGISPCPAAREKAACSAARTRVR